MVLLFFGLLGILIVVFLVFYFVSFVFFEVDDRNDVKRYANVNTLHNWIREAKKLNPNTPLCKKYSPCIGISKSTLETSLNVDGSGWVSVDFRPVYAANGYPYPPEALSTDPINKAEYYYTYCAKGDDWELNARFETKEYKQKMREDGGDVADLYEVGSNLKVCPN